MPIPLPLKGCLGTDHEKDDSADLISGQRRSIKSTLASDSRFLQSQIVASVIDHTYPNMQVVQLISSQVMWTGWIILLQDAYFTGLPMES